MKRLAIGLSDFKHLIEEDFYYFDKTKFIEEIIEDGSQVKLFARPRRFGKTLNMSMLKYFFDIENREENKKIFDYLMKMTNEFRRESLSFNESTKKYLENKRITPKKWTVFSIALLIIIFIILLYICSNE